VTASITVASTNAPLLTVAVTGKGAAPVASLSRTSVDFGKVNLNTNSATQTVTLTNTGDGTLSIASIVVAGTGFTRLAGACGTTLAPAGTCLISLRFNPPAPIGVRTGSVTLTDNSNGIAGSTQVINLTGEGVAPVASVNTTTLAFGNVQVGTAPTQDITLSNTGTGPLTVNTIALVGATFARVTMGVVNNCLTGAANPLAAGASCTIRIRFTPAGGPASGTVTITDNSNLVAGSTQTVALSGTGTIQAVADIQNTVSPGGTGNVNTTVQVRANDLPPNQGTISIDLSTVTFSNNGGATVTVSVAPNLNNTAIVWTTSITGGTAASRALARRGTYTVSYTLKVGNATSAPVTATLNLTP